MKEKNLTPGELEGLGCGERDDNVERSEYDHDSEITPASVERDAKTAVKVVAVGVGAVAA